MSLLLLPAGALAVWMLGLWQFTPQPEANVSPPKQPSIVNSTESSTAKPRETVPSERTASPTDIPADNSPLLAQNEPRKKNRKKAKAEKPSDAPVVGDDKYASAEEAFRIGSGFLAAREEAKSQEPLEAALRMSRDDEYRVKVYRALLPAYTIAADWTLKATALEFIITHSERTAERSLARSELLNFLRQRGKTADAAKRYEARLKDNPDDTGTLYILCEFYGRLVDDPQRAVLMLERYARIREQSEEGFSVADAADLAQQYVKAKQHAKGAELFEKTAARDEALAAWHYKEAAAAWLAGKDKSKALAAAKKSEESKPERRSEQLEYFWHRNLADVFLDAGDAAAAIPHYEAAVALTKIDGYRKDSEQRLREAQQKASK